MIDNPMASKFIRQNIGNYPGTLQAVFSAVNRYAYDASAPIEGPLGEGYHCPGKPPFDYQKLVTETCARIQDNIKSASDFTGLQLRRALADAALSNTELDMIIQITKEEALSRIKSATSADLKTFSEHGHHGRQYIAAHTVERVMKEVLPLKP